MKTTTTKDNRDEVQNLAAAARAKATPKKPINTHTMTMKREDWLLNEIATPKRAPKGKR